MKTEIFYPRDAMDVRKKFMFNQDYDDPNKENEENATWS